MFGAHKDSILGSLQFNTHTSDMFLEEHACDIASYANDNTQYTYKVDLDIPINKDCTVKL